MSYLRSHKCQNGSDEITLYIYTCDVCGKEINESDPHFGFSGLHYCPDCAFILGKITENDYLFTYPVKLDGIRAQVKDGEIFVWKGKKPPWKYIDRDYRQTSKYKEWRSAVFNRDKFTCLVCRKVGGSLQAHHIKPFATYKKLRYEVTNGATLCEKCHRNLHRCQKVGEFSADNP